MEATIDGPVPIRFTSEGKLHRGYRDPSGRFTLEQCNLSKSAASGDLTEVSDADLPAVEAAWDKCEHCF